MSRFSGIKSVVFLFSVVHVFIASFFIKNLLFALPHLHRELLYILISRNSVEDFSWREVKKLFLCMCSCWMVFKTKPCGKCRCIFMKKHYRYKPSGLQDTYLLRYFKGGNKVDFLSCGISKNATKKRSLLTVIEGQNWYHILLKRLFDSSLNVKYINAQTY